MKQLKYIVLIALSINYVGIAQQKLSKLTQTIKTDKNTEIVVNTSHVNLEMDTWNKNYIEIEAEIESDNLDKEALKDALEDWDLDIDVNNNKITITSQEAGGRYFNNTQSILDDTSHLLEELEINLSEMPIIEMENFEFSEFPEFPEMPEIPELPELPELKDGNYSFSFDVEKYKSKGDKYLKEWSKDFSSKYGETYKKQMEAWAKKVSQMDLDSYKVKIKKYTDDNQARVTKLKRSKAKRLEALEKGKQERQLLLNKKRKELSERRKAKHSELRKLHEKRSEKEHKVLIGTLGNSGRATIFKSRSNNENVIKTLKIKVPKKAKIKLDVQHGELILSSTLTDLQANLAYTKLNANRINGANTSINTSYSNVKVNHWLKGYLNLNHVQEATINTVDVLKLKSNASHVTINDLLEKGDIDHKFGDLTIKHILDNFKTLQITVQGSDALIGLPANNYNLIYTGEQSKFNNQRINKKQVNKNNDGNEQTIKVDAKFSNVFTN